MRRIPTILVAEDDIDDRSMMEWAVARWKPPHRLLLAPDSDEVASRLTAPGSAAEVVDLLILDHSIFPSGAVPLIRGLRATPGLLTMPIVVVSGEVSGDLVTRCLQAGASSVLRKPVESEPFRDMVCAVLDYWLTLDEGGRGTGRRLPHGVSRPDAGCK